MMRASSASVWDGQSGVFTGLTEWRMCGQVLLWCSCPFSKSAFTVVTWPTHGHTSPVSPLHDVRRRKKKTKKTHMCTHRQTHTSILYNVPYLSQWHESKQAKVAEWRDHRANEWQLALKHGGLVLRRAADNHLIFLREMFHSEKCPPASHLTLTEGVQCRVSHE